MKNKRNAREIREAFNLLMAGHHLTQDESEEPEKHELAIWYLQLERDAQMQSASEAAAMGHDEAAGDHDRQASALEQMISRIRALQLSSVAWNTGEGSGRNSGEWFPFLTYNSCGKPVEKAGSALVL